jgi:hypothetical protein
LTTAVVFAGDFGADFFGALFFTAGFGFGIGGWKLICIFLSPDGSGFPA